MLHNPGRATAQDHVDLHVRGTLQNLPTHVQTELLSQGKEIRRQKVQLDGGCCGTLVLEHFGDVLCQ